ncbi:fluoride efflux transporter FluC [Desulfohalovibrio reitneri]|uniref:fluoride efflux transporter FluC n=1 Tax=Desulfohalovibrio reitneri TaxID=1307759 RepID=UPI0004A72048|nr:CrcB family protein [Desulfohalovibrio reitneri]
MQNLALIALAGALGTASRYGVSMAAQRLAGPNFPLGTMVVNLFGALAFGLVFGLTEERLGLPAQTKLVVLTGFFGAFTTFSTYMFESLALLRNGQWWLAGMNIGGQTVLGLAAVLAGLRLARLL